MQDAVARARAADSLDEAARALKRTISTCRAALQTVRQVQAQLIGVQVETISSSDTAHGGVHSASNENQAARI